MLYVEITAIHLIHCVKHCGNMYTASLYGGVIASGFGSADFCASAYYGCDSPFCCIRVNGDTSDIWEKMICVVAKKGFGGGSEINIERRKRPRQSPGRLLSCKRLWSIEWGRGNECEAYERRHTHPSIHSGTSSGLRASHAPFFPLFEARTIRFMARWKRVIRPGLCK